MVKCRLCCKDTLPSKFYIEKFESLRPGQTDAEKDAMWEASR